MINKKRKGFTIVELVIVIAVIAVLAAVLIPTFSSVINKAKESEAMQEARSKYMEVYANDLEDGILNENVDESANLGYTYTTSNGTVIGFTYVKGGITVTFNGATNKWTVNGQIQGGNGGEEACTHPNALDDDCTTPVVCGDCNKTIIDAKVHDFSGNWEKNEIHHWHICKNEGCTKTDTHVAHTSENTPATCITKAECDICGVSYGEKLSDCAYTNGRCTVCGVDDPEYLKKLGMVNRLDFNDYVNVGKDGNAINLQNNNNVSINPDAPNPYAPDGSFSASFWIKITSAKSTDDAKKDGEGPIIFTNKDWTDSGSNKGYVFYIQYRNKDPQSGDIEFKFNSGKGKEIDRCDVQTTFNTEYLNEWIYVVCVVDLDDNNDPHVRVSFNFKEFITLQNPEDKSSGILTDGYNSGFDLNIGHDSVQKDNYMFSDETLMDDFMYFDEALTDDDVKALKAYYRIED